MEQKLYGKANNGPQLFKKSPAFYWTRRIITLFTRVCRLSVSWAKWIQSMPCHPIPLRWILILSPPPPQYKKVAKVWDGPFYSRCSRTVVHPRYWCASLNFVDVSIFRNYPWSLLFIIVWLIISNNFICWVNDRGSDSQHRWSDMCYIYTERLKENHRKLCVGSSISRRKSMKLTAHPHPLSSSRMSGAVFSLHHMPSLHTQGQLFLLTSSSSYICHGVGPLVDPFRSHVSRSLFKGLPWFLLPVVSSVSLPWVIYSEAFYLHACPEAKGSNPTTGLTLL